MNRDLNPLINREEILGRKQAHVVVHKKWQCFSETEERDERVLNHLGLVKVIALRIHQRLPVHVELDDIIHAGVLGLLDAVKKYDAKRRVAFPSYAKHRIRGAILDSLRQIDTVSRDLRRRWRLIESGRRALFVSLERDPTEAEIAEHLRIDIAELRKILREVDSAGEISTCIPSATHEGMEDHEFESKPDSSPEIMFSQVQRREVLVSAISLLRPRQQQVVRLYYAEHKTMKQIGLSLGVNESRVSQLHKSALLRKRAVFTRRKHFRHTVAGIET